MFANRLKALRAERNMTQVELAATLNVSKGTVAMWETNKRKPSYDTINQLSEIFDKRIDYILGYSDDASSQQPSEEDIEKMETWAAEERFLETVLTYLRLDVYGKNAVESVISAEATRCREQGSLFPESDFSVSIKINSN